MPLRGVHGLWAEWKEPFINHREQAMARDKLGSSLSGFKVIPGSFKSPFLSLEQAVD